MPITHKLTLDVRKRAVIGQQRVVVRQGEAGTQQIEAAITKDGEPYASSCTGARLEVLHADGTWARVTAAKSGTGVTVTLPSAAINAPGTCRLAHFVFHTGETTVETTEGFELRILPAVDVSGEQSKPYSDEIEALKAKWAEFEAGARKAEEGRKKAQEKNDAAQKRNDDAIAKAVASASGAADSANSASGAAEGAAAKANDAALKADAAAGEATSAAQAATSAAGAATASAKAAHSATALANGAAEKADTAAHGAENASGKATAAAGEAISAAGSATKAAGEASAAAVEAGAAAKRADEAAKGASENILTGTETAAVVHVRDAWPTLLRECKVLGKSVQDGTPTPDAPKPITSVGKAEVVTAGKNLLDPTPRDALPYTTNGITYSDAGNGMVRVQGTATGTAFLNLKRSQTLKGGCTYILSVTDKSVNFCIEGFSTPGIPTRIDTDTSYGGAYFYIQPGYTVDTIVGVQLEVGSAATPYAPHVQPVSNPIDLQGHELRSLPNGVRDEVVVDREGNVSLIVRTKRVTGAEIASEIKDVATGGSEGIAHVVILAPVVSVVDGIYDSSVRSDKYRYVGTTRERNAYRTWNALIIADDRFTSVEEARRIVAEENAEFIFMEPEKTIPLGKVSVPALPESTSNVWNADAITTDVSATYVRDVNIAFSKLESKLTQAVVATAANI